MSGDTLTLAVGGKVYEGWQKIRVTRGLDRFAADFDIEISERWTGRDEPWPILPFQPCTLAIGKDKVLTGYADCYAPSFDGENHRVRVTGRSKTQDLVDCKPEVLYPGQYNGYSLDALARAVCKPFGIGVVVQTDVGSSFIDASWEGETAYAFLERLCRLRSVLACDDERGNLVLTSAGTVSVAGALVQGKNILRGAATLTSKRFSQYAIMAQSGLALDGADVNPQVIGTAKDPGVPRYRPTSEYAESAMDPQLAYDRAKWRALYNAARALEATITVQGWRDAAGDLWRINRQVRVKSPYLKLNRPLLIVGVEYGLEEIGRTTALTLGPMEGYTPDPGEVKFKGTLVDQAFWNQAKAIK